MNAYIAAADEKILVLSRVASPQTATAIRETPGWSLWDKDDLSRLIRERLSIDAQERLVDIFFRGQRRALLGRSEPGPWLTLDEFFRPFTGRDLVFSHGWDLLGRETDISAVSDALSDHRQLTLLSAPGGMGKSRLLKEAMTDFSGREPATQVRFLSSAANATRSALEALGPGPKILIVDDAHDRDGLGVLFEFIADSTRQVRLLLATRPYALERIRREASRYGLSNPPQIQLDPLNGDQLRALAVQVLQTFGAPTEWADEIARLSANSPLVVTMAARVIAKNRLPFELAKNQSAVRDLILGKFADVIAGDLGARGDEQLHRNVLDLLALVQPFHPEDPQLLLLFEKVKKIDVDAAARTFRSLLEGGVAFRRGHQCRLMPDVLGDYLIETSCLDASGKLSDFALRTLAAVPASLLTHVLVNLGRLDWRRNDGDTAASELLLGVWQNLDDITEEWDPRLDAIEAVSLYQPSQALDFISRQVLRGRKFRKFSAILRNIAYADKHFGDVARLLWKLGRNDGRELGPHPTHAMRTLIELGEYDGRKSLHFHKQLLAFALSLADDEASWTHHYTPLDIMKPLLSAEVVMTESSGRSITMSTFFVNYDIVQPLRETINNKVLSLLRHPKPRIARKAAKFLRELLQGPVGRMGAQISPTLAHAYSTEVASILQRVRGSLELGVHPITAISIARSVAWQAEYGPEATAALAQDVLNAMPKDLNFRLRCALIDGYGQTFVGMRDVNRWQADVDLWMKGIVRDLRADIPPVEARLEFLDAALRELTEAGEPLTSAHVLIGNLVHDDCALARTQLVDALIRADSPTRRFAALSLRIILQNDHREGRAFARKLLDNGSKDLAVALANAYGGVDCDLDTEDQIILRELLANDDPNVVSAAIRALWVGHEFV